MKKAVNTMTNEVKSYFSKLNRQRNSNDIGKINLIEEIEENLAIHTFFNIDQKTLDNDEKMSRVAAKRNVR